MSEQKTTSSSEKKTTNQSEHKTSEHKSTNHSDSKAADHKTTNHTASHTESNTPAHKTTQKSSGGHAGTGKSSSGLNQNVASLLAYLFSFIGGIVFYLMDKDNKYIRFNAAQSIVLGVVYVALSLIAFIPVLGWIVSGVVGVVAVIFWVIAMIRSGQNQKFEIPIVSNLVKSIFKISY